MIQDVDIGKLLAPPEVSVPTPLNQLQHQETIKNLKVKQKYRSNVEIPRQKEEIKFLQ